MRTSSCEGVLVACSFAIGHMLLLFNNPKLSVNNIFSMRILVNQVISKTVCNNMMIVLLIFDLIIHYS
jgi:hypothetical protein